MFSLWIGHCTYILIPQLFGVIRRQPLYAAKQGEKTGQLRPLVEVGGNGFGNHRPSCTRQSLQQAEKDKSVDARCLLKFFSLSVPPKRAGVGAYYFR